jgi:hypothetical protein
MAKDKQPDRRAAGSADTPPTGVACAVAGNAETPNGGNVLQNPALF